MVILIRKLRTDLQLRRSSILAIPPISSGFQQYVGHAVPIHL
jgi:hypothetical protein